MEMKLSKTLLTQKPSIKSVIIGFVGLLVLVVLFNSNSSSSLSANGNLIFKEHQYWRLFTSFLVHADFSHLTNNAVVFTGLAVLLNHYFGWFVFPILSLLAGAIINYIALSFYPPQVYLVGISGVIYFMAAFWLVMYVGIERRLTVIRRLINSIGITLIFLFPDVFEQQTSYLAHALGFGLGIPAALMYFLFKRKDIRTHEVWVEKEEPIDWERIDQEVEERMKDPSL